MSPKAYDKYYVYNLAKMRDKGTITPEEYDARVALISDGDPYEEMFADAGPTLKPPTSPSSVQGDPAMSIKEWVMFFGILTLTSLVAWVIFILR